jgi:hypothetical protein
VKHSANSRLLHYISEFKGGFTSDALKFLLSGMQKVQRYRVALLSSGSKHAASVVRLKYRPGRPSVVIGQSFAYVFFSGPSKFFTIATDLCKACVSADVLLFK